MNDNERVKHAQLVKQAEEDMPHSLATYGFAAKLIRARYELLLKQGFSEQQALYLCHQKIEF